MGYTIYTDGSCNVRSGRGGCAWVILKNGKKKRSGFKFYSNTTNNRMEFMAVLLSLKSVKNKNCYITIHSDSTYVVNSLSIWWKKWKKNGWKKKNCDIIREILNEINKFNKVSIHWVKGHNNNKWNEYVDELAGRYKGKNVDFVPDKKQSKNIVSNKIKKEALHLYGNGTVRKQVGYYGLVIVKNNEIVNRFNDYDYDKTLITINKMKLNSVLYGFRQIQDKNQKIIVHCNTEYIVNCLTVWLKKWKKNGWKTIDKKPVKNKDLILEIEDEIKKFNKVFFVYNNERNKWTEIVHELVSKDVKI